MREKQTAWMRLSLGAGVSVQADGILGIFDMDTATVSPATKKFLNTAQKHGCVDVVGDELPKSFVVSCPAPRAGQQVHGVTAEDRREMTVSLSQFSPATLCGRERSVASQ